jgi:arginyl-tRNA synthetase
MLADQKHALSAQLATAAKQLLVDLNSPDAQFEIVLDRPRQASHGDLACNLAMQLAKPLKLNPREVAQRLLDLLRSHQDYQTMVTKADIAGPGFINFSLSDSARQVVVKTVLTQGAQFGQTLLGQGKSVMIEFVSANPTGPLHVGHARQGALGDILASILTANGYRVSREFYYNDAGGQIENLALSVQARLKGISIDDPAFPENGYRGEYINDIARDFTARATVGSADVAPVTATGNADDLEAIRLFAVAYLRHEQDLDLKAFGVRFDCYYLESSLYTEGRVDDAVARVQASGKTYEQDGALWFASTAYGDDKDRVMRKGAGGYTYFVPDIAYHISKWQRGFHKVINVQGSDHHGTIARVRAGLQAANLNIPANYPDYVLHKMVRVIKGGEEVKMSKRAGTGVTLRDLLDMAGEDPALDAAAREERGRDAVRFFLGSRKADSEYVFDVDLALARSDENPVYYIHYAHARICRVLIDWSRDSGNDVASLVTADLSPLTDATEVALMARLAEFPEVLEAAGRDLVPHAVAFYLKDVAADFHTYYNAQRALVDDDRLKRARLALWAATRQVLRNGLAIIGVSAPEKM